MKNEAFIIPENKKNTIVIYDIYIYITSNEKYRKLVTFANQ